MSPVCAALTANEISKQIVPDHFSEEAQRAEWDQGCEDWPQKFGTAETKRAFEINTYKAKGKFRVFVRLQVNAEGGETAEHLRTSVEEILAKGENYERWILPGINDDPDGGTYFVTIAGLQSQIVQPLERYILNGPYNFQILWFHAAGVSSVLYRKDVFSVKQRQAQRLDCPLFSNAPRMERFVYRMTPRPGLLDMLMAEAWVVPHEEFVEVRARIVTKPASLVYELLPEKMVQTQIERRGRKIFENFLDYRRLGIVPKAAY